jgi:hypothetical protein
VFAFNSIENRRSQGVVVMRETAPKSPPPVISVAVDTSTPKGDVLPALARLLLAMARRRLEESREREKAVPCA